MDILIIEDDPLICRTIRNGWPLPGDKLHFATSFNQSIGFILSPELGMFDAIVVDVQLPDGNGLHILTEIRNNSNVPVIMISGLGTPESRANTLDVGADDYLMKPFSVRELQARIARRITVSATQQQKAVAEAFFIGGVEADLKARHFRHGERVVSLTDAEARILGYLCQNAGRNCSKSAIYKHAFFRNYVPGDKTLDVYIGRIRRKLAGLCERSADHIHTARGAGYRLEVEPA